MSASRAATRPAGARTRSARRFETGAGAGSGLGRGADGAALGAGGGRLPPGLEPRPAPSGFRFVPREKDRRHDHQQDARRRPPPGSRLSSLPARRRLGPPRPARTGRTGRTARTGGRGGRGRRRGFRGPRHCAGREPAKPPGLVPAPSRREFFQQGARVRSLGDRGLFVLLDKPGQPSLLQGRHDLTVIRNALGRKAAFFEQRRTLPHGRVRLLLERLEKRRLQRGLEVGRGKNQVVAGVMLRPERVSSARASRLG